MSLQAAVHPPAKTAANNVGGVVHFPSYMPHSHVCRLSANVCDKSATNISGRRIFFKGTQPLPLTHTTIPPRLSFLERESVDRRGRGGADAGRGILAPHNLFRSGEYTNEISYFYKVSTNINYMLVCLCVCTYVCLLDFCLFICFLFVCETISPSV